MNIRTAGIVRESITDGPGIRFVLFVQGCPHHCRECHNDETWDFNGGVYVSLEKILQEIEKNKLISGVTFSGGEPFEQAEQLYYLAVEVKKRNLNLVVYTGYYIEELWERNDLYIERLLDICDYLIDGPYIAEKRDLTLKFRGSSNQRIIDMKKTKKSGKLVLANQYMVW